MKRFLKKNKKKIVLSAILIFILLIFITFYMLFFSTKGNRYGNRLDDIGKVKIKNETVDKIKDELKSNENIVDVKYHLEGKLVNFIMTVNKDADKNAMMGEASKIIENLSDDVKKVYDIEVFIDSKEESETYPVIGYKHKTKDNFTWNN